MGIRRLLVHLDGGLRGILLGFALAAIGTTIVFAVGDQTSGIVANVAAFVAVIGMALVFVGGAIRFATTISRIKRRLK